MNFRAILALVPILALVSILVLVPILVLVSILVLALVLALALVLVQVGHGVRHRFCHLKFLANIFTAIARL